MFSKSIYIIEVGVIRDASDVDVGERGANIRGERRQKQAHGAGLQGPRGTLVVG